MGVAGKRGIGLWRWDEKVTCALFFFVRVTVKGEVLIG